MRPRLAALTVILTSLAFGAGSTPAQSAERERDKRPRTDLHGDPLPTGATARMGTLRYHHGGNITFLACLPRGKMLTAGTDGTARLWDLTTHKEIRRFQLPRPAVAQRGAPAQTSFFPTLAVSADGTALATPDGKGVRSWNLQTGKERDPIKELTDSVVSLALSPDGTLVAATTSDGAVSTWDVAGRKQVRVFSSPRQEDPDNRMRGGFGGGRRSIGGGDLIRYSPDGKRLAAVVTESNSSLQVLKVWDVGTGKELNKVRWGRGRSSSMLGTSSVAGYGFAFSPDGKVLGWSSPEGIIHLEDAATGKPGRYFKAELDCRFAITPDGKTLLTLAADAEKLQRWEVETGDELSSIQWPARPAAAVTGWTTARSGRGFDDLLASSLLRAARTATALALSPDGKVLAENDGYGVLLVDLTTGKTLHQDKGHAGRVASVEFSADGKILITRGVDRTVRSWDVATGGEKVHVTLPDGTWHALSPDGKVLAYADLGAGTVSLADAATGKVLHTLSPEASDDGGDRFGRSTTYFAFTPDGLAVNQGSKVRLYDTRTGKVIRSYELLQVQAARAGRGSGESRTGPAFLPGGKLLLVDSTKHLDVRSGTTGELLCRLQMAEGQQLTDAAASADERTVAVDTGDGQSTLFELATGKERGRLGKKAEAGPGADTRDIFLRVPYGGVPGRLVWSPDGKLLARADGARVRLWDVAAGAELGGFDGHLSDVVSLAFARGGDRLATGSADGHAMVWDVAALVKARKPRPAPTAEQVKGCWAALGGEDAARAFGAINDLSAVPQEAVALLKKELKPVRLDLAQVEKWVRVLDSDNFKEREQASEGLRGLGAAAVPVLRKALAAVPKLEARLRLEELTQKVEGKALSGEYLRAVRAVEVLERIATPQAREVLKTLGAGAAEAPVTEAAAVALKRLGR